MEPAAQQEANCNKKITSAQQKDQAENAEFLKLLLLGSGESGKSTIFKQVRQIYSNAFNDPASRQQFTRIIENNIVQAMRTLVEELAVKQLTLEPEHESAAQLIRTVNPDETPPLEAWSAIKALWADPAIRSLYGSRASFQLLDSCNYFFDRIDEIGMPGYVPSYDDVLHARARTSGILETIFVMNDNKFRLIDVGGQKNERKKWIHQFENVTSVLFVVALSEYDQLMFEDQVTNRMVDSLELFDQTANSEWFLNTPVILFLNKRDLFEAKATTVDLRVCFPDYTDGLDAELALQYIRTKFESLNKNAERKIYVHVTCATDQNSVAFTFDAIKDIIIASGLKRSGLQ